MRGRPELEEIADRVLEMSGADQTEVMIAGVDNRLTRFAANTIHQNVNETDVTVRVRAIFGKKVGVASTNDLSIEALRRVVASAETVARFQQDNPDFESLPGPAPVSEAAAYAEETASSVADLAKQAEEIKGITNRLVTMFEGQQPERDESAGQTEPDETSVVLHEESDSFNTF